LSRDWDFAHNCSICAYARLGFLLNHARNCALIHAGKFRMIIAQT
jgi:hypothetical protein